MMRWGHHDQWQGSDAARRESELRAEVERLTLERDAVVRSNAELRLCLRCEAAREAT